MIELPEQGNVGHYTGSSVLRTSGYPSTAWLYYAIDQPVRNQEDAAIITFRSALTPLGAILQQTVIVQLIAVLTLIPVASASGGPLQARWEYGVFTISTRYGVANDGVRTLQYMSGSWKNSTFSLSFNNAVSDRSYQGFARKLTGRLKLSCVTCELPVFDALGDKGWEMASHNKDASDSIYQAQAHTLTVTDTYWFKRTRQ